MKVTLIRHAEVEERYLNRYNGHIDIALSKHGKEQALLVAKEFENANFDAVYCSDLVRAKETLKPFKLQIQPTYLKELREKSWGEHEGKSFEEITQQGIEYQNFHQWVKALGGESIPAFTRRIKAVFYKNIFQTQAKNILVLTHSGVIKTLLSLEEKISLEEAFSKNIPYTSHTILYKDFACTH